MSAKAVAESTGNAALYAYRHVSTNQVLYSLTEALIPSALQQLPDLGANRKPATIRRDMWRPFFTVDFGQHDSAPVQAQHAYEKLLEWRRLHEVSWKPPPELALSYTEEQVQTIKDDMVENRGGAKLERAYDLIKRHKKNMKARIIMDQKANSVADLAAVLLEQRRLQAQQAHEQRAFRKLQSAEVNRLVDLANSPEYVQSLEQKMEAIRTTIASQSWEDSPEVTRLKKQIHALETRVQVIQKRGRGQAPLDELAQAQAKLRVLKPQTKAGLQRELDDLERQQKTLEFAVPVLEKYNFTRMVQKEILTRLRVKSQKELDAREVELDAAEGELTAASEKRKDVLKKYKAAKKVAEDHVEVKAQLRELKVASKAVWAAWRRVKILNNEIAFLKHQDRVKVEARRMEKLKAFLRGQRYTGFPDGLRPWSTPKSLAGPRNLPTVFGQTVNVGWEHKPDRAFAYEWPESVSHLPRLEETNEWTERRQQLVRDRLQVWEKSVVRECKERRTEATHSSTVEV